jgi:glutathione-regulated potassium-efflux system protein KefB
VPEAEAAGIAAEVRRRDAERLELEIAGGLAAGAALIHGNAPRPTPFTAPRRAAEPLSEETAAVAETAKPG